MNKVGLVIAIEDNIDDVAYERLKSALLMVRGVLSVQADLAVSDHEYWAIREQVRSELFGKLFDVLKNDSD